MLRVVVRGLDRRVHEEPVTVVAEDLGSGREIELRRGDGEAYHVADLPPGRYLLGATTGELSAPTRAVDVVDADTAVPAYLGETGWPFVRIGRCPVPFPPPTGLLAVVFPQRVPTDDDALAIGEALIGELRLEPIQVGDRPRLEGTEDFRNAEDAIWLFRIPDDLDQRATIERVRAMVEGQVDTGVRVGVPVDLRRDQLAVIDSVVSVRFADGIDVATIEEILAAAGARLITVHRRPDRTGYIAELPGHPLDVLAQLERWHEEGLVVYAEPDLMIQIVDTAFPTQAPDDPGFAAQANIVLHRIDQAWRTLASNGGHPLGDPGIVVATVDRGVQMDHPDVGDVLSSGAPQLAWCYDFAHMRWMSTPGYGPSKPHGMGVLGIIAAHTDNAISIAGIAPNTRQTCVERPTVFSRVYWDLLRWVGGLGAGQFTAGWPALPGAGAAVIACAHEFRGWPTPGGLADTFDELADHGRAGRGTVVIYSAGNSDQPITGYGPGPGHPTNLAIANSLAPDAGGVERRDVRSNYGPEVAVCAQGENSRSLDDTGGEQTFDGTSAACALAAGVVALVLSHTPALSATDVRARLTSAAAKIDPHQGDPKGAWVGGFSHWYGHGRIDAAGSV